MDALVRYDGRTGTPADRVCPVVTNRGPLNRPAQAQRRGQATVAAERRTAFADYQVDDELFTHAAPDAVFMHCLPAKRGEEVTDSVMEHERSAIFDQAENRLHAQKALLLMMLA